MPRIRRRHKERASRQQIARAAKKRLTLLIAVLTAILLALIFKVGQGWWPAWMILHRGQIEGMILLAIVLLILLSPIIVEASSNPRALSGPGKYPGGPRVD